MPKRRIKLNPVETKVIIFSRSILARKTELNLKLYGKTLKIYPQVKFLGITFDSQLNFKKHFEEILDRCNTRYHRTRLLVNKKWGPSPATLIQRVCSVKVWCTKIAHIFRIMVQTGASLAVWSVTDIITYGIFYFSEN